MLQKHNPEGSQMLPQGASTFSQHQAAMLGASSLFKSQNNGTGLMDSPTRRFTKPKGEAKISSDLLGAGDDPMSKN